MVERNQTEKVENLFLKKKAEDFFLLNSEEGRSPTPAANPDFWGRGDKFMHNSNSCTISHARVTSPWRPAEWYFLFRVILGIHRLSARRLSGFCFFSQPRPCPAYHSSDKEFDCQYGHGHFRLDMSLPPTLYLSYRSGCTRYGFGEYMERF